MISKNSNITGPKTIYIGNMSYKRNENSILKLFKEFGYVQSVSVVTDSKTKKSKGIAFVKMKKADEALLAIKTLDGKVVDGRTLKVSEANARFDESEQSYKKSEEDEDKVEITKPRRRDLKRKQA